MRVAITCRARSSAPAEMVAESSSTGHVDIEIRSVVDPRQAVATNGEMVASLTGSAPAAS